MSNNTLPIVLAIVASAGLTAFYYENKANNTSNVVQQIEYPQDMGRATMVQGLYVFINAEPQVAYSTFDKKVDQNTIQGLIEVGENKNKWDALRDIGRQAFKEISG